MTQPNESGEITGTVEVAHRCKVGQAVTIFGVEGIEARLVSIKGKSAVVRLTVPMKLVASGVLMDLEPKITKGA